MNDGCDRSPLNGKGACNFACAQYSPAKFKQGGCIITMVVFVYGFL